MKYVYSETEKTCSNIPQVDKGETDWSLLYAGIRQYLDINPSIRAVFLLLHSAYDEKTKRAVNLVRDLAPALSKDKTIRVYTGEQPYRCLLEKYEAEPIVPEDPKDKIYGMFSCSWVFWASILICLLGVPELTLGVTGPIQKIIRDKLRVWLDTPLERRKTGTRKITDMWN